MSEIERTFFDRANAGLLCVRRYGSGICGCVLRGTGGHMVSKRNLDDGHFD